MHDIPSLSSPWKYLLETDEVRLQNRTEMESHITQSVNDNINTQMSNIKNDLKQTKFSVTLKEDQLQIFREFLKALSPEARSEFGEFLDKHVKHPQFRNPTNSLRSLRSKPPRMRFLLFKLAFCHILTDMSVQSPLTPIRDVKLLTLQNV